MKTIKIGIDVGGTFTHAVAIRIADQSLLGKACVPTTHHAKEGVARGVVDSLHNLLDETQLNKSEIALIAHSTTQATNALLEGDTAVVGILGIGEGIEAWRAKQETNLKHIELSPGKYLQTRFQFINRSRVDATELEIKKRLALLVEQGAEVLVVSEAFGVDHPELENQVVEMAQEMGVMATAGSQISKLYGLRVRTRTAVINASMMPKMLDTANLTEQALKDSGIDAPLMVMRSDGGIMDINEMRRRPILTMLSGPAAGVAAALMYARISDGIFIEVGGTSSDISVIKNGMPQVKTAQIGKNRLYVQTLDIRTLGIAGGSVPRVHKQDIVDVGPRSAHIANLNYPAFQDNADFSEATIELIQPKSGDPKDYLKLKRGDDFFTITPTEAAYYLDVVQEHGHGAAHLPSVKGSLEKTAELLGTTPKQLAEKIQILSASKIEQVIRPLMREYKLDADLLRFVGGGGGASAIVPFCGKHMNIPHTIAENHEVISAIGAALGLIRDRVERHILNPTDQDIIQLRQEALRSVLNMGADPDSIEVSIEVDQKHKKVIAIATGASDFQAKTSQSLGLEDLKLLGAESLRCDVAALETVGQTEHFLILKTTKTRKRLGIFPYEESHFRVLDDEGTVRLGLNQAESLSFTHQDLKSILIGVIERKTSFGDAGGLLPDLYLILPHRIVNLSGLMDQQQILALAEVETQELSAKSQGYLLIKPKK